MPRSSDARTLGSGRPRSRLDVGFEQSALLYAESYLGRDHLHRLLARSGHVERPARAAGESEGAVDWLRRTFGRLMERIGT